MKRKILIFTLIIILIVFAIIYGISFKNNNKTNYEQKNNSQEENKTNKDDALKFKRDYESLNGTIRELDGATYGNVTIPEDNPIIYISVEEALEISKTGNGVIYVGSNSCPWCRINTPIMLEVAKDLNIETIYYLTLSGQNSSKDQLRELKNILYDDSENSDDDETIRISIPYYVVVKDGEIIYTKRPAIRLNEGQTKYDDLTEDQHDELYNIFKDIFTQ